MLATMLAFVLTAQANQPQWKLVWQDEFNGRGPVDNKKWDYEEGFIRNKETQYYTRERKENVRREGGSLIIEARKDDFLKHLVSSGSINTLGKASWKYGRFEIEAQIPTGRGVWPAFWMMGDDIAKVGWPKCGEIDVMESVGHDPSKIYCTAHWFDPKTNDHKSSGGSVDAGEPWKGFHVYAVEWFEDRLDFYYDKTLVHSVKKSTFAEGEWPYNKPHYILLNLAIGGEWGAQKGIDDAIYPSQYKIDYVRVYQGTGRSAG